MLTQSVQCRSACIAAVSPSSFSLPAVLPFSRLAVQSSRRSVVSPFSRLAVAAIAIAVRRHRCCLAISPSRLPVARLLAASAQLRPRELRTHTETAQRIPVHALALHATTTQSGGWTETGSSSIMQSVMEGIGHVTIQFAGRRFTGHQSQHAVLYLSRPGRAAHGSSIPQSLSRSVAGS